MPQTSYAYFYIQVLLVVASLRRQTIPVVDNALNWNKTVKDARLNLLNMSVDLTKNPVWVSRMGAYFDSVDVDKTGTVDIGEFLQWAENMRDLCKATDSEMTSLREQLKKFWGAVGLKPGKEMTKEEFLHGLNSLAQHELERKRKGEKTFHEQLNNAFFDVMDINHRGPAQSV